MKIEFENQLEKETLKHILTEWFSNNDDYDVLGCEPACRDECSPGCEWCISEYFESNLSRNRLSFNCLGGEKHILEHTIAHKDSEEQKSL